MRFVIKMQFSMEKNWQKLSHTHSNTNGTSTSNSNESRLRGPKWKRESHYSHGSVCSPVGNKNERRNAVNAVNSQINMINMQVRKWLKDAKVAKQLSVAQICNT